MRYGGNPCLRVRSPAFVIGTRVACQARLHGELKGMKGEQLMMQNMYGQVNERCGISDKSDKIFDGLYGFFTPSRYLTYSANLVVVFALWISGNRYTLCGCVLYYMDV